MELNTEEIGEVTVVSVLTQVIDAGNADDFKTGFASIVKGCKKIVLELSRVILLIVRDAAVCCLAIDR